MQNGELVSLGLPVFNGERFIAEAIDSALSQTYRNLELVVSDNASTDRTQDVIRSLQKNDDRIRYFRQDRNIGLARNWNFVVRQSRGQYFKFVSANDRYSLSLIEECMTVMAQLPDVVLCYGRTQFIGEDGQALEVHEGDFEATASDALSRYEIARSRFSLGTPIQSGVVRFDALRSCRELGSYMHSDRVLTAELALRGKIVLLANLHFFRRLGATISTPMKNPLEAERAFRPAAKRAARLTGFRMHGGHLLGMIRAPISPRAKLRGILRVLRYAYWDRRALARDIGNSLSRGGR